MNERIKELAEQVKVIMDGDDDLEFYTEKFAELIVRECAQVGVNAFERNRSAGLDDIRYAIHGNIVNHFGVEE